MLGMQQSDVQLGVVVFGRLVGFPWWPAIVSRSSENGKWRKDGKFWVLFFNDNNGAWLKTTELRSYDSYNKSLSLEQNAVSQKFRRYKDRVDKAIRLADKFVANPKGRRGSKGLPPRPENYTVTADSDDDESDEDASDEGKQSRRKEVENGTGSIYREQRDGRRARKRPALHETDDDHSMEKGENLSRPSESEDGRPRRKRIRSSRYEDFITPIVGRQMDKRKGSFLLPSLERLRPQKGKAVPSPESTANKHGPVLSHQDAVGKGASGNRPELKYNKKAPAATQGQNARSRNVSRVSGEQADVESLADTDSADGGLKRSTVVLRSRRLANEAIQHVRPMVEKNTPADLTRQLYISELTSLTAPKGQTNGRDRGKMPSTRRSVRSRAGSSEYDDSSGSRQDTDSEEEPERHRKITNGSLEVAAEELMEYAVRDGRGADSNSSAEEKDVPEMHSVALGGNDLVCSILNRISSLERDVLSLQYKAKREEVATLGEDATAAGLKAAVEALASASAAFSKARDYDPGAISRSLELLWNNGHFPLSGPDGELLRTMSNSLVLAPCRRRREQVAREKRRRNLNNRERSREHRQTAPVTGTSEKRTRDDVDKRGSGSLRGLEKRVAEQSTAHASTEPARSIVPRDEETLGGSAAHVLAYKSGHGMRNGGDADSEEVLDEGTGGVR